MSGAGRVERASSNDLVDLMCDLTGTSMQVAAVLVPAPVAARHRRRAPGDRGADRGRAAAGGRLVRMRPSVLDRRSRVRYRRSCAADRVRCTRRQQALVDGNLQPGGLRAEVDALQLRIQDRERVEDRGQGPDRPRPARGAAGAPSLPLRGTGRDAHPECRTTALRSGAARAGAARRAARARCRPRC